MESLQSRGTNLLLRGNKGLHQENHGLQRILWIWIQHSLATMLYCHTSKNTNQGLIQLVQQFKAFCCRYEGNKQSTMAFMRYNIQAYTLCQRSMTNTLFLQCFTTTCKEVEQQGWSFFEPGLVRAKWNELSITDDSASKQKSTVCLQV